MWFLGHKVVWGRSYCLNSTLQFIIFMLLGCWISGCLYRALWSFNHNINTVHRSKVTADGQLIFTGISSKVIFYGACVEEHLVIFPSLLTYVTELSIRIIFRLFPCDNVDEDVMLLHGEPSSSPGLPCLQMSWKGEGVTTFLGDVLRWHGWEGLICLHWSVLLASSHPAREKEGDGDK